MIVQQLTSASIGLPQRLQAAQTPSSAGAAPSPVPAVPLPSGIQVQQAVEQIQHVISVVAQNLQFSVDQGTGRTVIRVVDSETQEVIRQIPSEEVIAIANALDRMQGLLFDGKA